MHHVSDCPAFVQQRALADQEGQLCRDVFDLSIFEHLHLEDQGRCQTDATKQVVFECDSSGGFLHQDQLVFGGGRAG